MVMEFISLGIGVMFYALLIGLAIEVGRASAENVAQARKKAEDEIARIKSNNERNNGV